MNNTNTVIEFNRKHNEEGILSITRSLPFGVDTPFNCGKTRFSVNLLPVNEAISAILYINEAQMSCISSENAVQVNRKDVFRLRPDKTVAVSKTYNNISIKMQVKAKDNSHLFEVQLSVDAAIINAQALYESSNNDLAAKYDNVLASLGTFILGKVREIACKYSPIENRELENALKDLNEQLMVNQPIGETFLDFLNINFRTMKWMTTVDQSVQAKINSTADNVVTTHTNVQTIEDAVYSLDKLKGLLPSYYFDNEEYLALWLDVVQGKKEIDTVKQIIDERLASRANNVDEMVNKRIDLISGLVSKGLISAADARILTSGLVGNQYGGGDYSSQPQKVSLLDSAKADDELSNLAFDDDDDFSEE